MNLEVKTGYKKLHRETRLCKIDEESNSGIDSDHVRIIVIFINFLLFKTKT